MYFILPSSSIVINNIQIIMFNINDPYRKKFYEQLKVAQERH